MTGVSGPLCGLDTVTVERRLWNGLVFVFAHHSHRVALSDGDVGEVIYVQQENLAA